MDVRTGAVSRAAGIGYHLAFFHGLTDVYCNLRIMSVQSADTVAMIDLNQIAITAEWAALYNSAVSCCNDRCPCVDCYVDTCVQFTAVAER